MPETRRRYNSEFRERAVRIVRETGSRSPTWPGISAALATTSATAGDGTDRLSGGDGADLVTGESGTADLCDGGPGFDRSGPGCES